jgi:hypothetical protein
MPRLAQRIAGMEGTLDAAVIGRAAALLYHDHGQWREFGDYQEVLRFLRQRWHVLVHFGERIEH